MDLAVFRIPVERIEDRSKFFLARFSDLANGHDSSLYRLAEMPADYANAVAECYFLLNGFYKYRHGIAPNHPTDPSKIAALTAAAISNRKLLQRKNSETPDLKYEVLNPLFGIRLGLERLNIKVSMLSFEERDRLVQTLIDPQLHCLDNYFWKLSVGKHRIGSEIEFEINSYEMGFLEGLISSFHFLELAYHGPLISSRIID